MRSRRNCGHLLALTLGALPLATAAVAQDAGRKAAEAGRKVDLVCTTSAHGAASPKRSDWSVLAGKEVIILPDHDQPGMNYAQEVARICMSLPKPAKVMMIELPELKQGEDLYDWIECLKEMEWKLIRALIDGYVGMGTWLTPGDLPHQPQPATTNSEAEPVLTNLAEVKAEPIRWLWEGKLALGKLSGWAGGPRRWQERRQHGCGQRVSPPVRCGPMAR